MRHSLINELIYRALGRAGVAAMREPSGLVSETALHPDGATVIPWVQGKCLAWDATTPDTLAASHIYTHYWFRGRLSCDVSVTVEDKKV